jgi:hypothetical protein
VESYGIKMCGTEVIFNVITFIQNFIESHQSVQKLLGGFLCTYLRSLNIRHFGMVEAAGLKKCDVEVTQWHHLCSRFHLNLPVSSKLLLGDTDRQTDW